MEPLDHKFSAILKDLEHQSHTHNAGDKQLYYLTYPVTETIALKRKLDQWFSVARHKRHQVDSLSLGQIIQAYLQKNPRREHWLPFAQVEEPEEMTEFFEDLASIIVENQVLEKAILEKQASMTKHPKPLLILTDLEGLHPFTRFGPIEQNIYHELTIPMLVLYPGQLQGSSLEFLGFYPPDGNYRSKHF